MYVYLIFVNLCFYTYMYIHIYIHMYIYIYVYVQTYPCVYRYVLQRTAHKIVRLPCSPNSRANPSCSQIRFYENALVCSIEVGWRIGYPYRLTLDPSCPRELGGKNPQTGLFYTMEVGMSFYCF